MPLHELRSTVRRQVRRRRRPLAAILAALAVAVGLGSLDRPVGSAGAQPLDVNAAPTAMAIDEVAVPVTLANAALAQSLAVGDVIDVVALTGAEQSTAHVVAPSARVIDVPSAGGFGGSSSSVVVLAVAESDALDVSAASADSGLRVVIRARAPR